MDRLYEKDFLLNKLCEIDESNDEIGSLKRDLTLYLDMEVLFDIYGYNGKVFQKLALDLFKLARDANSKEKKGSIQIF